MSNDIQIPKLSNEETEHYHFLFYKKCFYICNEVHAFSQTVGGADATAAMLVTHCLVAQPLSCSYSATPWTAARQAPVHHHLPESAQTHVHWVGDAIQPSHPLLSPSPPALNLSQHQGLFQWVSSSHEVAKVLEFQLQHQSFQWTPRTDLLQDGLVGSPCSPRDSQAPSPTPQFKSINSLALSLCGSEQNNLSLSKERRKILVCSSDRLWRIFWDSSLSPEEFCGNCGIWGL